MEFERVRNQKSNCHGFRIHLLIGNQFVFRVRCIEQYPTSEIGANNHQKEELDAAEALTFLAGNCKSRWVK